MTKNSIRNTRNTVLDQWEELFGELKNYHENDEFIKVSIETNNGKTIRLEYPLESKEGKVISSNLEETDEGKNIGILRTDLPNRIAIRVKGRDIDE